MEIVDIECEGKITPPEVLEKLNQTLPPGVEIMEAEEVPFFFPTLHPLPSVRLLDPSGSFPFKRGGRPKDQKGSG